MLKVKKPMTDKQLLMLRQKVLEMSTTGKDIIRRKAMRMYVWLTAEMMRRGL